jgi:acyl-CoA synthetase (AMP-forming)/AMP-acid ligase II
MATPEVAIRRLQQTRNHLRRGPTISQKKLSVVHGSTEPALVDWTLANLLDEQGKLAGDSQCLIVPFSNTTWTFSELRQRARDLAKGLLALGLKRGDRIGILAGNCEEYVTVFYACGYIGAILVVLNSTYTAAEAKYALKHSGKSSDQYLKLQS